MGDHLTNEELRRKLKNDFNYICGPILDSTRELYCKKLESFMKERSKESSRRRSIAAFTSPLNHLSTEENDNDSSPFVAVRSSPRNSYRRSAAPFFASTSTALHDNQENGRVTPTKDSGSESGSRSRQTRSSPKSSEDSVSRASRRAVNNPTELSTSRRKTLSSVNPSLGAYSSEESDEDESPTGVLYNYITSRKSKQTNSPQPLRSTTSKVPLPRIPSTAKQPTANNLTTPPVSLRKSPRVKTGSPAKRLSYSSGLANFSDSEPETEPINEHTTESIRDQLLRYRASGRKSNVGYKNSTNSGAVKTSEEDTNFYSSSNGSSSSNWISFTILCVVIFFFVIILSVYCYSKLNFASFDTLESRMKELDFSNEDINAPICVDNTLANVNCFESRENVTAALFIVKLIQNFIKKEAVNYLCESSAKSSKEDPFLYSLREIRDELLPQRDKFYNFIGLEDDLKSFHESINKAIVLIKLNPQWNVEVNPDNNFIRIDPDTYQLSLSLSCRVRLMLAKTIKYIGLSVIVIAIVGAVLLFVHWRRKQAAEQRELIYDLVEKSLDLLQSPDNPQSMPVNHIRDMLFTTQERQNAKSMDIWAKVVKFIEESESRVKVDMENIDGEDYKTWKWIAISKGKTVNDENASTTMKTGTIEWQGQAFCDDRVKEGLSGNESADHSAVVTVSKSSPSPNATSNFVAPTCFLKVRNMYNPETQIDPNWKLNIENAILEKCSANAPRRGHGVLHIHVEDADSEGVVYVKCDSRDSATDAFHALHGWWCERKLVSVRFLKEERYYSRFPEARHLTQPLQIRHYR